LKSFKVIFISTEEIQQTGMVMPFAPEVYKPILNRLKAEGLNWTESSRETF